MIVILESIITINNMLGVEQNYSYINSPQTLKYWNKTETLQHESFTNRWKYASFKVFVKLKAPLDTEQRHKHKKVSFLIGNLIIETAVCVTFMQSRSRWKHSTEHFQPVWEVISLIRIERFFSVLNVTNAWFIFIVILIAIPFLCIVFNTVRTFRHNKIIDRMKSMLVLWPLSILSSFVMISVVSTLYASLKYGMNSEEENELEFNALLFRSTAICYISVILLGIHFLLVNIANLINTEARHDMIQIVPYAKANIRSDFYKLVGIHGMMVSYYFILEKLAWLHYLLVCIACSFMWLFYYFKHPYYKPMINSLCANQFTVVGFVAFSYFVGEMMGNNAVSFILSVFATPFIVVIAHSGMKSKLYRLLHNLHDQIEMIETQDSSELLLRPYLISKSSKVSEIFEQLYKNKQLCNSKLLNILDSFHTYTFHKDKPLARVKLSLAHNSSASLELDYRYYQCRKLLSKDSSSETLRYLRYCKLLISTQTHDYGLCMQLKNLWSDLSSKDPSGRKVREHIVKIRSLMKMSNLGYSRLIERYPTIPSSYENYGTLLSWIYNEQSSYIGYLHNAKFLKNEYIETSRMDDLSLFHPNTGVMVISCNPKIFGRVVYCNEAVCELLKYSYSNLIGSSFTDLIPEPYRNQHGNLMQSALNTIDSTKISTHSSMLYLLDFFQFILPVKCLMRFDANNNFPCCLITISKCSNNFELALINDYGHIISHSKEFSRYINIKDKALFGHNLYTYIPRLKGTHLNPIRLLNSRKAIHMIHAFAQEFLHTVFIYTHKEDLAEIDLTKVCKYSTKAKLKDNKDLELSDIVEYDESLEESRYFEGSITYADSNSSRYITHREKEEELPFQPIKFVDLPMHFGSTNTTSLKSKSGIFEVRNKSFIISISQKVNYLKIYTGISVMFICRFYY